MKYLFQLLIVLTTLEAYAQTPLLYNKFYSSDSINMISNGSTILPYTDTSFVVANTFYSNYYNKNGLEIIHFNYNGQVIWRRVNIINLEGPYTNGFGELIRTQNGGFAFMSFRNPYYTGDMHDAHLMLFDSLGIFEYEKLYTRYPGSVDRAFAGCQTTNGDFLLTGFTFDIVNYTASTTNIYVIKTDAAGDTIWTKMFDYGKSERAGIIREDYDGGYLLGGFTATFTHVESDGTSDGDGLIYKLNADGSVQWMLNIGTPDDDCDAYIVPCKTEPGKYYVWSCDGKSHPAFPNDEVEGKSYYISKIDSIGNVYWRTPMSGYSKGIKKAIEMPSGKILLVGSDTFCADETNWCFSYWGWMALLDSSGIVLWDRTFYLYNEDEAYGFAWLTDAIPTPDGGFIAVGRYPIQIEPPTVAPAVPHVWLLKVDENGCITPGCNEELIFVSVNDGQFILFENDTAELPIFPNPATYTISIHTKQPWQNLFLYNLHGQEVASYYPPNPLHNLPLPENLPNGLYIAQLTLNNGTIQTTKLLISK